MPDPNLLLALALALGTVGIVALVVNTRLEVTVALLALYLGLLDGPVKLLSGQPGGVGRSRRADLRGRARRAGAPARPPRAGADAAAVGLGDRVRRARAREAPSTPTRSASLKILGGFRQQLEWVPFFFFGYVLMRSRTRFRQLFVVLGLIALANGAVSLYQTRLTPAQLASWGPGYSERRVRQRTRSPRASTSAKATRGCARSALGSDAGFGGSVGVIALAGTAGAAGDRSAPASDGSRRCCCVGALLGGRDLAGATCRCSAR